MYNNLALTLYFIPPFEQFPTFSWSIPARLLAHVNFIWYKCLLLLLHSLKPVILTTEEVIKAILKLSQPQQKLF